MNSDFIGWEFRIIRNTDFECQKILNQWRIRYELNIISVNSEVATCKLVILLARREI